MVKDIFPGSAASNPSYLRNVGGTLFFTAPATAPPATNSWASDGTESGTVLMKDIRPGLEDSAPRWLTDFGGVLFFSADDGSTGRGLWKSDGTPSGTTRVKAIDAGAASSSPKYLTNVNGTLFFQAKDASGPELWTSNGSATLNSRVKDITSPGNLARCRAI